MTDPLPATVVDPKRSILHSIDQSVVDTRLILADMTKKIDDLIASNESNKQLIIKLFSELHAPNSIKVRSTNLVAKK